MRKIYFTDHLEEAIAKALDNAGIKYVHESENKEQGLDFYLPKFDVYLEVKQFHADRISRQMRSKDNVIAIQGMKSLNFLITMINQTVV